MSSAEMWWARSWWWPTANIEIERLPSPGRYHFTGNANGDHGTVLWNAQEEYQANTLHQYSMAPSRMPETGCTFRSSPILSCQGVIRGWTFNTAVNGAPSSRCNLRMRQRAYLENGAPLASSSRTVDLLQIVADSNVSARPFHMPSYYAFDPISFDLNREERLIIDLELTLTLSFKGPGTIAFSPHFGDEPFWVRMAQWPIIAQT